MAHQYTEQDEQRLQLLLREYWTLAHQKSGSFMLRDLFSDETFDIVAYCKDFQPSCHARASEVEVKKFAQLFQVWVEKGGDHYNNMTAYLHPTPDYARLTAIGKAYAVLFFMNDTIGREKLGHMSPDQIAEVRQVVHRLDHLLDTGSLTLNAGSIERAALASLREIRLMSEPGWYRHFLTLMKHHFEPSFFDRNARAQGHVMSVEEYIDCRLHVSGMYATIALMEFGDNAYINWAEAKACGIGENLERLQWLCAAIGALMNDLFSFEKEFVVEGSDFNLVPTMALTYPEKSLQEIVEQAATLVREYVKEFRDLSISVQHQCLTLSADYAQLVSAIEKNVLSLIGSVQATWVWENNTERYKQQFTIFKENQLTA